ncbi:MULTISPECIES: GntR family transcriptional regulator [Sphingomonadaceae]|uniref:GntR family transcriptional regulator n=1 Tax=Sphingomonas adhaesiva TaxID=28212 RepID=A0A2A4I3N3_9SPHN|nr:MULTISPECIES: GntR family transcriptional regulator [Sphingomonadaceae]PCG13095.1 GntR family transcriptional regulator [Sphingomonas adhaesiva]QSR20432.1 GntR family transcriptional regulator [Novosphingobium sp. KA1]BAE75869.1 transcriptional regulator of car operon [Novosphingobium sp. KA1]BAF03235.1 transcriptional regulator of car operon [Novosphingobium sp. KA1]
MGARSDQSLAQRAADLIREGVRNGEFAPGHRLVEGDLARLLQLGRGPVREALRLLSVDGLVTLERNKGAVVSRASRAMLLEIFEVRELLEGLAARRAAANVATRGPSDVMHELLREERERDTDQNPQVLIQANERLHRSIVEAADAVTLGRVLGLLDLPDMRLVFFRIVSPAVWRSSRDEHIAILEAIVAGEPERAEEAMRAHVRHTAALSDQLPSSSIA